MRCCQCNQAISPPKLLVLISKSLRLVAFVKEQRKLKLFALPFPRWFWVMENNVLLVSFSKEGTFPDSLLLPKFSLYRLEALDIEIGIDPVYWFPWIENISKFGRVLPMSNRRCPRIWFNPTSILLLKKYWKLRKELYQTTYLMPHQRIQVWSIGQKNRGHSHPCYYKLQKKPSKEDEVMFGNSFCFLFSKTCFWEYKEKTIFLYFWNQKHVWLSWN